MKVTAYHDKDCNDKSPENHRSGPQRTQDEIVHLDDEALAAELASGQDAALQILVHRHTPAAFHLARWILRSYSDAEEVVQQVFIEVYYKIAQFDPGRGSFASWIRQRVVSRAIDQKRHLKALGFYAWLEIDANVVTRLLEESPEFSHSMRELLQRMDEPDRDIIILTYYEGLTAKQVAQQTGETLAAVQHRLRRAMSKLRALYKRCICIPEHKQETEDTLIERS
jgi:RNA polymerase sigma-70 factor, ECF subfamily